jgi:hypothetical protein
MCSSCFAESIGVLLVKIGRTIKRLLKRGFFLVKIAPLFPKIQILKNVDDFILFPCFAESIGVLLVKIGRTVEKLFKRGVFEKTFLCSPKLKF